MRLIPSEPDIETLVRRISHGEIDLQPEFQRNEVWSKAKQKRLIDTVLRGWSIPPVHLVANPDKTSEVLDGQQRLAALRDFLDNKFSIDGRIEPLDESILNLHGLFYRDLPVTPKRAVDQYTLRCFYIVDYKPEEPSELFYRLNLPTTLTSGEQRNALFGPARDQLKSLVDTFVAKGNDVGSIGFSNVRLAYDDVIARLLYFDEIGTIAEKITETKISDRFKREHGFSDLSVHRCEHAIELFSSARRNATPYRLNKASLLSWLIFFLRFEDTIPINAVEFFGKFVAMLRDGSVVGNTFTGAIELFQDRSSLRVTDVSSVVYRDVSLIYLFRTLFRDAPLRSYHEVTLSTVWDMLVSGQSTFADAVESTVQIPEWGKLR